MKNVMYTLVGATLVNAVCDFWFLALMVEVAWLVVILLAVMWVFSYGL